MVCSKLVLLQVGEHLTSVQRGDKTRSERSKFHEMNNNLLLIEDNPQIGEVASMVMGGMGWTVTWVCDVQSARSQLDGMTVSVVLLDLGLPDANGLDLVKVFIDLKIPVLIWTVDVREVSIRRALELGASGYITKEETPEVLTDALRAVQAGHQWLGSLALSVVNR